MAVCTNPILHHGQLFRFLQLKAAYFLYPVLAFCIYALLFWTAFMPALTFVLTFYSKANAALRAGVQLYAA